MRRKYTDFVELKEAKDNLTSYFKKYNLNPQVSHFKDPVHGPILRKMVDRLNLERAKVLDGYRLRDYAKSRRIIAFKHTKYQKKMAKRKEKVNKADLENATEEKTIKVAKKEKTKKASKALKYDYPLVDGREMTVNEKKKYRLQQRKIAKGEEPQEKKATKETPKKVIKKEKVEEKPIKKIKKAKSKKDAKDED